MSETRSLPLHFKLYRDGDLVVCYTQALILPSDNFVCLGYGPMPYRLDMEYVGGIGGGWYSFRTAITAADGSRLTYALPFLVYARPAQFPSVLVAPCVWEKAEGFPDPPKMFVVTAQCPDPLKESNNVD
jgi:hypothetical protein